MENLTKKKKVIEDIIKTLRKFHSERNAPVKNTMNLLSGANPFQILIFVFLSSRTKDEKTIEVCKKIFKKIRKAEDVMKIELKELEKLLYGVGFYKTKAKRLKEISKILMEKYNGKVPRNLEELINLPGIGRKTANIVLSVAYNINTIGVDTHVHRISNRIGIVETKKPEETEEVLRVVIPKKYWKEVNYLFVAHGQTICKPIKPLCKECPIKNLCNYYGKLKSKDSSNTA